MKEDSRLVKIDFLAAYLGVSKATIRKWVRDQTIPFIKVGGRSIRFSLSEINAWMEHKGGSNNG